MGFPVFYDFYEKIPLKLEDFLDAFSDSTLENRPM